MSSFVVVGGGAPATLERVGTLMEIVVTFLALNDFPAPERTLDVGVRRFQMCLGYQTVRTYRQGLNIKLDAHNTAQTPKR